METVVMNYLARHFRDRNVLITGHTGFKGSWLSIWLREMKANVFGYSLEAPTTPSLFEVAGLEDVVDGRKADIRDSDAVTEVVEMAEPDVVIHMAAQAIVRESYTAPVETFSTNIMGVVNVLEAVMRRGKPCVLIIVTSDKCYENKDWLHGYRESDRLGGSDPYSASKGCAELVAESWRRSFGDRADGIRTATVRAGNVIGGGDWGKDRIVPDCIRALVEGADIEIRNPIATRPWQHVLEPLSGYLLLGAKMLEVDGALRTGAWNFGPSIRSICQVETLVEMIIDEWGSGGWRAAMGENAPKESMQLALNWEKAFYKLGWEPTWNLREAVKNTVDWYKAWQAGRESMYDVCARQIVEYQERAAKNAVSWAQGRAE